MYSIVGKTADEVWFKTAQLLANEGEDVYSRNFKNPGQPMYTQELMHVMMTITNPRYRLVFSRPINPAFGVVEAMGILAGANTLEFIEFWNPRMKTWATKIDDEHSYFYGAYGSRLGCRPNLGDLRNKLVWINKTVCDFDQLKSAYLALKDDPDSRQVVLNIYDSRLDMPDGAKTRNPDVPCNLIADLKVRDGKLHWMQTMRSNDLMWGTPYNFIQWMTVQEVMAGWLGLEPGQFTLSVSSLHVYEHHFKELKEIAQGPGPIGMNAIVPPNLIFNPVLTRFTGDGYEKWEKMFKIFMGAVVGLSEATNRQQWRYAHDAPAWELVNKYDGWLELLYLLVAESARRLKLKNVNLGDLSKSAGPYYELSWNRWRQHVESGNE